MLMDVLSRLIEKEIRNKRYDVFIVNVATSISLLMCVDEILLFSKANSKSLNSNFLNMEMRRLSATIAHVLKQAQRACVQAGYLYIFT